MKFSIPKDQGKYGLSKNHHIPSLNIMMPYLVLSFCNIVATAIGSVTCKNGCGMKTTTIQNHGHQGAMEYVWTISLKHLQHEVC